MSQANKHLVKQVVEKKGSLPLESYEPVAGMMIVKLKDVGVTQKGILMNQSQYDAAISVIDTSNPIKVLKVGKAVEPINESAEDKLKRESAQSATHVKDGDYAIINGGVDGFIFFTTDYGRVALLDIYAVQMLVRGYEEPKEATEEVENK